MGGTFGEVHGAKLVGLLRYPRDHQDAPRVVLLMLDTGGDHFQEANMANWRFPKLSGRFWKHAGGPRCDRNGWRPGRLFWRWGHRRRLLQPDNHLCAGHTSISGPEVIETNMGVEEFDSRDRPLVWRTTGGKSRRLLGGADAYAEDNIESFRDAAIGCLTESQPSTWIRWKGHAA